MSKNIELILWIAYVGCAAASIVIGLINIYSLLSESKHP